MIIANVVGQNLSLSGDHAVSDSVKFLKLQFKISGEWVGYTNTAVFRDANKNAYSVVLKDGNKQYLGDGICYVPFEVIKSPEFTVSLFGVKGDSVITTPEITVFVRQSGYGDGAAPSDPTPSEYEQLVSIINETQKIALSVRNDADNGVFKGEKGDRGPSGVYVGPGDMPEDCNVQIDPEGDVFKVVGEQVVGADYVVAQGTHQIEGDIKWRYELWESGKAECWGIVTRSVAVTQTADGSALFYGDADAVSYPQNITVGEKTLSTFFTENSTPICDISQPIYNGGVLIAICASGTNANSPKPRLFRGTSRSEQTYTLSFRAVGRWK